MSKKKIAIIAALALMVSVAVYGYIYLLSGNTKFDKKELYVFVPTGSKYEDVLKIIEPYVKDIDKFKFAAEKRSYDENVFPGRFLFKKGMNNLQLVSALRHNMPLNLAFNNQESLEKLVSRISSQMEVDSTTLINTIRDSVFMEKNGFNNETILGMFIPNTYEMKWNTPAEKIRDKMADEYHKFWNSDRLAKAKELGMTPVEVITLAAIVHKETVKTDERPRVAGVYLNRLKQEMPLQADPTVIYAVKRNSGDFNQIIKRVRGEMLRINSPYNTYVNIGLPPGPIAMPDISAVDAVLNAEKHDYIYFCASVERFGYHDFATTYEEHQVNARKYAEWVTKLGIEK
ncbi:endolytic transglycosylase MltG [Flavobacterium humi]|uniref:Endolytic murein transglycosylase n=1 Tax=Flavobacterium humi TaxID=2562683 RepID=A0A4Z0L385_9FLAO|nr:endolytic transglycosylase MltG [Flavobacterium humi]TGD56794.1 endolytic transglycosylase MltG [Flavobacterium humi]